MSQEKVLRALQSLGLTQADAQVYVFLGKKGPQKAKDIAVALGMPKQQLYAIIKNLESKGIVNGTLERPARFSALRFEKVLDLFVKAKMEEAQRIRQNKTQILSDWQSIAIGESGAQPAKFTVFKGRNYIYSKIKQIVEETKNQISIISTVPGLMRADQFGLVEVAFRQSSKSKVQFRFLTELSSQNVNAIKNLLERRPKAGFSFEGRTPELGLKLFTRMVIRDDEEAVFFISPGIENTIAEQDDLCLWTDCRSLVNSFTAVFEELWRNSINIEEKIAEIETGKQTPKTNVISDAEIAYKKYHEAMRSAEKEIVMITSSKGLAACCKNMSFMSELAQRGVSVRLMAPITSKNLKAAQQLLKFCQVRHVPAGYLGTTIVDGQHLFQFKNPSPEEELPRAMPYYENTFYTNDIEHVEKSKNMLNYIWKNAHTPSAVTLESVTIPNASKGVLLSGRTVPEAIRKINGLSLIEDEKTLGKLTEKDVLDKIINAQKYSATLPQDTIKFYGTNGQAIIHPPEMFNLPDILFHILHIDKHSSFGAEDAMLVMLWLETPKGHAYVPVAFVGDNPDASNFWKRSLAGIPAGQNCQLVKRDELEVRLHGNILFCGWTVQIPLFQQYKLPPSCIMVEGQGDLKTLAYTVVQPSGWKMETEYNGFEAFVTFLHPSSKYSGPGTDGFLARDVVWTINPP